MNTHSDNPTHVDLEGVESIVARSIELLSSDDFPKDVFYKYITRNGGLRLYVDRVFRGDPLQEIIESMGLTPVELGDYSAEILDKAKAMRTKSPYGVNQYEFKLPLPLFLNVFNALPLDSQVREELLSYIKNRGEKGSYLASSLLMEADGTMTFSEELYSSHVWEGKIGVYSKSSEEHIQKALEKIEILQEILGLHQNALAQLPAEHQSKQIVPANPNTEKELLTLSRLVKQVTQSGLITKSIGSSGELPSE